MSRVSAVALAAVLSIAAVQVAAQTSAPSSAACTDFYGYVNGVWEATTELPADRARTGSFDDLRRGAQAQVAAALEAAQHDRARLDTPGKRLAADFYASGLDRTAIERRGLRAVAPLLARIDKLESHAALPALLAELAQVSVAAPMRALVGADARDKRRYRLQLFQDGLGLPDRDDYFRDDARAREVRAAYRRYLRTLLEAAGMNDTAAAAAQADAVLAFETRLAQASLKRSEMRDPTRLYHLLTPADLAARAPGFDWAAFIGALGLKDIDALVVAQPGFIAAVAAAAHDLPLATWRAYLRARLLDAAAPFLPAAFDDAHFAFRDGVLQGLQQRPPRGERLIALISGRTGGEPLADGLGQLYVAAALSPQAKARAETMVADIRQAMRARIARLDWMTPATRQRAIAKLDAMTLQIGHPDRWKTYDGLVIARDDFAGNWLRAQRWEFKRRLARIDQPVDRGEWFSAPHVVNAFAGGFNNIVFPAAILQPPFFDAAADDATNFGAIGMVIGHEITHHFDDRGRRFDEVGNLNEWWTAEDAAAYQARADRLAAQFGGYQPLPGQPIDGVQTLGENISDLAGIKIAFDGLQRALARTPATPRADGRTPAQQFFIAFAIVWRDKLRTEALLTQLRSGAHSPPRWRVLGPLANMPQFAQAFGCPPGSPMLRPEAEMISIW